jgi:hypothetical protein
LLVNAPALKDLIFSHAKLNLMNLTLFTTIPLIWKHSRSLVHPLRILDSWSLLINLQHHLIA